MEGFRREGWGKIVEGLEVGNDLHFTCSIGKPLKD